MTLFYLGRGGIFRFFILCLIPVNVLSILSPIDKATIQEFEWAPFFIKTVVLKLFD